MPRAGVGREGVSSKIEKLWRSHQDLEPGELLACLHKSRPIASRDGE